MAIIGSKNKDSTVAVVSTDPRLVAGAYIANAHGDMYLVLGLEHDPATKTLTGRFELEAVVRTWTGIEFEHTIRRVGANEILNNWQLRRRAPTWDEALATEHRIMERIGKVLARHGMSWPTKSKAVPQ